MEKQQYILNLSLQQIALRKVAIVLWHQPDILALVKLFRCQSLICDSAIEKWQTSVENVLQEKISLLLLPDSLKEELKYVIKPIGPEIIKWRMHHKSLISNACFDLDRLSWTSVGRVDYRKTAEILIRQERLNDISSYKLACVYCLEDHIQVIWEKLSEDGKKLFYDGENILRIGQLELVRFWTYLIKGKVAQLNVLINRNDNERERTIYQYAFESAAVSGNKAATEYFLQKLTFEEREASLLKTAQTVVRKRCLSFTPYSPYSPCDFPKENFCDVLCYLLCQMKKEEQIEVFKTNPYRTLRCFMDWPWQDLFMKVVVLMWSFLPIDQYGQLMLVLYNNRTMTGYKYPQLFGELFLRSPSRYRKYMIDSHREYGCWFRSLVYGNHTDVIKLVLRNVSDEERHEFIMCEKGLHLSWKLIEEGKWSLLDLFVSECRLSSEAKTILKNSFMRYLTRFYKEGQIKWRKRNWVKFFQLIDNANVNDGNKRIIEEVEKEQKLSRKSKIKRRRRKY